MSVYGAVRANTITANGSFAKSDSDTVAWSVTDTFVIETQSDLSIAVGDESVTVASGTAVVMPETPIIGADYAIWVRPEGVLEATSNHSTPPVTGARKVGGFHYAPGGNATAQAGGNSTAQINPYSCWDVHFRPVCPDPRGMTLVDNGFWVDIYLTGVDAITNGSSAYNVTIADGSSPPKIPTEFGGNGTTTYGSYTWFEAQELAMAFGKRSLTQQEFMAAAYGVTEATSIGTDPVTTGLAASLTSRWGLMQATGVLWVWGQERGGPYAAASWNANTEGRGSEYAAPNAALLGGNWGSSSSAGSRCSFWYYAASSSVNVIGSRFACDHLQLG